MLVWANIVLQPLKLVPFKGVPGTLKPGKTYRQSLENITPFWIIPER
jgi:hypothetical protein